MHKHFGVMHIVVSFLCFGLIAFAVSLPRFGQFENEYAPALSDSAFYHEMAKVFFGQQEHFTEEYVAGASHHYNRPLFPWLAGLLNRVVPALPLRASFSLINILASALIAVLLYVSVKTHMSGWQLAWLPSLLFLTAFPQLNWGYHLLTDTLGLATAMACTLFAVKVIDNTYRPKMFCLQLLCVFALSAVSFLTRETGWFAVITLCWIGARGYKSHSFGWRFRVCCLLAVILLGRLPHQVYESVHGFRTPGLDVASVFSFNPVYWFDVFVKVGVAFHVVWFIMLYLTVQFLRKRFSFIHPTWMTGWTLAACAYSAAAYAHNDITVIGFPMRIAFSVFPVICFYAEAFFEQLADRYRPQFLAALFVIAHLVIGWFGVLLDPGVPGLTVRVILQQTFGF